MSKFIIPDTLYSEVLKPGLKSVVLEVQTYDRLDKNNTTEILYQDRHPYLFKLKYSVFGVPDTKEYFVIVFADSPTHAFNELSKKQSNLISLEWVYGCSFLACDPQEKDNE